ncbi:MAG: acetyl-CoA acetyltransferase [Planctomycetes bacterium]|nr:acetyl-CoA acetyltransferase [Planctomycetota bacterium]
MGISRNVAIIGSATTKFGELFDADFQDLLVDASFGALEDAGIGPDRVGAAWLGCYLPMAWGFEGNSASLSEALRIYPRPVTRVTNYCCTGMEAVRGAAFAVASGEYDFVLAVGIEKMREVPARASLVAQHVEKGHPVYCKGRTAPGMFALCATRYLSHYSAPREALAHVAVKNHANGARNPKAHFRKAITLDQALKAPEVAAPLGLYDCCPTTDGAAAVVLTRPELAKEITDDYVLITGVGLANTSGYYSAQMNPVFDFTSFPATKYAAAAAYRQAGVRDPGREIDVAEVHDCFTITEIINYEDLGFAAPGEGWRLATSGDTALTGRLPVNTSGGLKSMGHPIGASGVRMIADVCDQLRGRAEQRQVKKARRGLAHTLGGPGAVSCVFVMEKA